MKINLNYKFWKKLTILFLAIILSIPFFTEPVFAANEADGESVTSGEEDSSSPDINLQNSKIPDAVNSSTKSLIKLFAVTVDGENQKQVDVEPLALGFKVKVSDDDESWYAVSEDILSNQTDNVYVMFDEINEQYSSYGDYFKVDEEGNVIIKDEKECYSWKDLKSDSFSCSKLTCFKVPKKKDSTDGLSFEAGKSNLGDTVYVASLDNQYEPLVPTIATIKGQEKSDFTEDDEDNSEEVIQLILENFEEKSEGKILLNEEGKIIGIGAVGTNEENVYLNFDATEQINSKISTINKKPDSESNTQSVEELKKQLSDKKDQVSKLKKINKNLKTAIIVCVIISILVLIGSWIFAIAILKSKQKNIEKLKKNISKYKKSVLENSSDLEPSTVQNITIGKITNIGKRNGQQDRCGISECGDGYLAVLADGMGGLQDGDKVSQKIIDVMMNDVGKIPAGKSDGILYQMASNVNEIVNQMLGPDKLYKCGSTLVAVLADRDKFNWLTIGDSRLYLFRSGMIMQINREHVFRSDLLLDAINKKADFREVLRNSQLNNLTSFVGMGELKYVDGSFSAIRTMPGDRLLLMSDGVFNTLTDIEIENVMSTYADPQEAANILQQMVLGKDKTNQDNFTAVILSFND